MGSRRWTVAAVLLWGGVWAGADEPGELERLRRERAALDARIAALEKGEDPKEEREPSRRPEGDVPPVIVTATRLTTPLRFSGYSGTVVSARDIASAGHTEVQDVLRAVPGLDVVRTGTRGGLTSLFIRGGESDHNLILLDGFKVNVDGGTFDHNSLTLDNVDRVEVVRGAGSAADGSYAVAGVVNVVSRRGEGPPRLTLSSEGGSLGSFRERLSLTGGAASHAYAIDASFFRQDDGRYENSDVENRSFAGRFDFRVSDATDMWLTVREARFKAGLYTTSAGPRFDPPDPNDLKTRNDFLTGLNVRTRIDPGVWESRLRTFRYFNQTKSSTVADRALSPGQRDTSDSFLVTQLERAGVDWQNAFWIGDAAQLVAGVEYEGESFDQESLGSTFGTDTDQSRLNFAGYLEGEVNYQEVAFLRAGVRGDDNSDFGFARSERLSGALLIEETDTKLRSSYGTGIKIPTFFEIHGSTTIAGLERNPEGVDLERSQTVDAGVDQRFFDGTLTVGVTGFYSKYKNLVEFVNNAYDQGGRAFARGAEIEAAWRPNRMWDVLGNWTFLGTRVTKTKAPSQTFIEGDQLLRRPADKGSATVRCRPLADDALEMSLMMLYVGQRDDLDFNTWSGGLRTNNDNYTRFDAAASYRFAPGWRLFGSGQNIFNEEYEEIFGFPADKAVYMVGVEYEIAL